MSTNFNSPKVKLSTYAVKFELFEVKAVINKPPG